MSKLLASLMIFGLLGGCIVPQPPGNGQLLHMQEPITNGWFWLYLPEDYSNDQLWPAVVSFHGMKPFDNAKAQAKEWQQEADRYGFVIIAPELVSCSLLAPFPIHTVHPGVERDVRLTIAVLDMVAMQVVIDPNAVLSTSWSSGGYLAHYIVNKHPDRFSCIGVRQSNFSASLLDPSRVPLYRDYRIGIFYTENDFAICRRESREAIRWYNRHGFNVSSAVFKNLGHERRPSIAANFFAGVCGVTAKTPPIELSRMRVKD